MRVLVTGVDCFIAGWLVSALVADGVEIFGISRKSDGKSGGVTRHRADVRDADALAEVVKATHPDRVFHLAAQ
ncbi:MAG TPA: NAD-dependent epimerase/dehydratase family protein, partial [Candidatus Limnocylindria bacterium]|nr:NAD-dependent epimerase/dehydratase family protein [Candidatus Limnocylindria bacterium]